MRIYCLIEDHQVDLNFGAEHGVSFYVETKAHKVLFDVGQSALFLSNALKLNLDISLVDTLVISHGHYDHGGGLEDFLRVNKHANIYIQEAAFNEFYSLRKENEYTYIGLDQKLVDSKRFIKIKGDLTIDDELTIISDIKGNLFFPKSNHTMFEKIKGDLYLDDFKHEQNLLITDGDKRVLFAGCAHKGIVNIMNTAEEYLKPHQITAVFGGFHFKSRFLEYQETKTNIEKIALIMKNKKIESYYTGHCTGKIANQKMRTILKERLNHFYPGLMVNMD